MKKLTILLILISNISLAQTFNFGCDYNYYSDPLYSSILPDSSLDTRDVLEVFIDDAINHNYSKSLQGHLELVNRINVVPFNSPDLNGLGGYATYNCATTDWRVYLDTTFWDSSHADYYKMAFLYHELGHALLRLDHSDNPKDIMYPTIPYLSYSEFRIATERLFGEVNQNSSCKGIKKYYD